MAKPVASRGLRDEMNVGPDPRSARLLVPLRELGKFRVADGEPDVRGWTAFTSAGREIGRVHELLVDTDAREVVMLDIDLRRDDRHTLVPIRASWVDQGTRRVVVDAAEVVTGDELPALDRGAAAAASRPDVLADWQPARRPVAPDAPALAADGSAASRVDAGMVERAPRDRRAIGERVVERRPMVEEVVVRRREAGTADRADDTGPGADEDTLLGPRSDDAAGPPR